MKEAFLLLGNLLVHPVKTVKGTALLTYRKGPLYVLGFLLLCIVMFPGIATVPNATATIYISALFAVLISLWIITLFTPLIYFIALRLAKADIAYRTARRLYLPCIILNLLFSTVYSMLRFWIPALTTTPVFSLLVALWYAAITFLFCKYKFSLPERRCWLVFSAILLLEIVWRVISFLPSLIF